MMDQLRSLLEERRWLVIAGAAGVLFFYSIISHVFPLIGEIRQILSTLQTNQEKIELVMNNQVDPTRFQRNKEKLKKQIEEIIYNQNQDTQLSAILTFLSKTAQEKQVEITLIKPEKIKQFKRHVELPLQLKLRSGYHNLGRFINSIEASTPVIKINRLKMTTGEMVSSELEVKMILTVYYLGKLS